MDFRTELIPSPPDWTIGLNDPIITFGSCFSDTIGKELLHNKFQALVNPFGTTYHPLAIGRLIEYACLLEEPGPQTYFLREGMALNYDFHSRFSGSTMDELRELIRQRITQVNTALGSAAVVMITYGTAWLYEKVDDGQAVANCHRMPGNLFRKRLVSVDAITASFRKTLGRLRTINPRIRVILTVSPVRHSKDTLPLNSVSKATLLLACHQLSATEPSVTYFPAYELLMDDLRDYRFYGSDLIHPSPVAEAYIWDKFNSTYFAKDTREVLETWTDLRQALGHRPFHPGTDAHQQFLLKTIQRLEALLPRIDVQDEISALRSQLKHQPA